VLRSSRLLQSNINRTNKPTWIDSPPVASFSVDRKHYRSIEQITDTTIYIPRIKVIDNTRMDCHVIDANLPIIRILPQEKLYPPILAPHLLHARSYPQTRVHQWSLPPPNSTSYSPPKYSPASQTHLQTPA
jgi:hypothetical protein